jgi:hypothetical protein
VSNRQLLFPPLGIGDIRRILVFHMHDLLGGVFSFLSLGPSSRDVGVSVCCDRCHVDSNCGMNKRKE